MINIVDVNSILYNDHISYIIAFSSILFHHIIISDVVISFRGYGRANASHSPTCKYNKRFSFHRPVYSYQQELHYGNYCLSIKMYCYCM